jgi:hypothetical protein
MAGKNKNRGREAEEGMNEWGNGYQMIDSRMDRPASTQTAIRQKETARQEILSAVALFLAQGGSIKTIPSTISKEAQLGEMRAGRIQTISMQAIADRWGLSVRAIPSVMAKWPTLMYIMSGTDRLYSLEDIQRVEKTPGYKLHKSTI